MLSFKGPEIHRIVCAEFGCAPGIRLTKARCDMSVTDMAPTLSPKYPRRLGIRDLQLSKLEVIYRLDGLVTLSGNKNRPV